MRGNWEIMPMFGLGSSGIATHLAGGDLPMRPCGVRERSQRNSSSRSVSYRSTTEPSSTS